jgi:hypothetical protein
MDRREFIGGAIAVAAVALAAPLSDAMFPRFGIALFDARYGDSRAFADTLVAREFLPLEPGGDVAALWYARLRGLAVPLRAHIAGLTTYCDFQVLTSITREHGFRVSHEGRQQCRGGTLFSWLLA